jgi:hypothetical protein
MGYFVRAADGNLRSGDLGHCDIADYDYGMSIVNTIGGSY